VGFRSQPAGYPAITPYGHRGVSALSFRDGAIPRRHRGVKRTKRGSRGPFGYPAITPYGHRGVSTPFFRDGAIRFYSSWSRGKKAKGESQGLKNHLPRDNSVRSSRRKRPFFSRRRDTLLFELVAGQKKQRANRKVVKTTYPAITPYDHRGVSAPSFRDGAIPRHHRGVKRTKRGSRGPFGYPAITPHEHRGVPLVTPR
jgi:hypothetical protein